MVAKASNVVTLPSATELEPICRKFGVVWLAVFGSYARGEARPDSDVDVAVRYAADASVSLIDMVDLQFALSPIFGGRKVDLGEAHMIHPRIKERVLAEAKVLYAQ
jgi:hypothetical protein